MPRNKDGSIIAAKALRSVTWDLEQQPDGTYDVYRARRGPVFVDMTRGEALRRIRRHRTFQAGADVILAH